MEKKRLTFSFTIPAQLSSLNFVKFCIHFILTIIYPQATFHLRAIAQKCAHLRIELFVTTFNYLYGTRWNHLQIPYLHETEMECYVNSYLHCKIHIFTAKSISSLQNPFPHCISSFSIFKSHIYCYLMNIHELY